MRLCYCDGTPLAMAFMVVWIATLFKNRCKNTAWGPVPAGLRASSLYRQIGLHSALIPCEEAGI